MHHSLSAKKQALKNLASRVPGTKYTGRSVC